MKELAELAAFFGCFVKLSHAELVRNLGLELVSSDIDRPCLSEIEHLKAITAQLSRFRCRVRAEFHSCVLVLTLAGSRPVLLCLIM